MNPALSVSECQEGGRVTGYLEPPLGFMAPGGGTGPKTVGFAAGWIRGLDEPPVTFLVEPK